MRLAVLLNLGVCLVPWLAMADPNNLEGGVFIAHYPAAMEFSSDPPPEGWCESYLSGHAIGSCEEQVNRIDTGDGSIWFVLAAWDEDKRWCGVDFGLGEYSEESYVVSDHGPCYPAGGLAIPTQLWPRPNSGVSCVVTDSSWTGNFTPI